MSRTCVLLLEDYSVHGELEQKVLEGMGFGHIYWLTDGARALSFFSEEVMPRIEDWFVIMDLNLGTGDRLAGLKLIQSMRAEGGDDLPVLITTAVSPNEVEQGLACLELSVRDVLYKPFSREELRTAVQALLKVS
jgi:DNA-binding response OmpR family regulator